MIYTFDRCELDVARHRFRFDGVERALEPQVFDLLHFLVQRPGLLVTRDTLVEAIWDGRIVSEATISARINAARRALNDDGRQQRVLRTVPRRGIQLVCTVATSEDGAGTEPSGSPPEQRIRIVPSVDGTLIAYATTGVGPPLLRVGHWLTHLELDWRSPVWRPLLEALGADFAVTRYDQRGCGVSGRDVARLDLEAMVEDLEAVADAANLDRFPIFAASQGVPVTIAFAARHPGRVSRMVLYGGYAVGRRLRPEPDARAEAEAIVTLMQTGWGRPGSAFVTAFTALFMPEATRRQIDSFVAMQLASADAAHAVRLRNAIDRFDIRDLLARVEVPALVIHARSDAVQPLDQARLLAAGLPHAELLVLESNNHIPLPHEPAWTALVDATRSFCRS